MTITNFDPAWSSEDKLKIIKVMHGQLNERIQYSKSEAFETDLPDQIDQVAYLTVSKALSDVISDELSALEKLIVGHSNALEAQMAQVIGLFDGNRRQGRA